MKKSLFYCLAYVIIIIISCLQSDRVKVLDAVGSTFNTTHTDKSDHDWSVIK